MKYLVQFLIIIAFSFVGELMHRFIPLPIPASIYGIILLFLALEFKLVKFEQIKDVSSFLIAIMPLLFLPPAVGLVDVWGALQGNLAAYIIIMIVSTFIVMAITGWVTEAIIKRGKKQ